MAFPTIASTSSGDLAASTTRTLTLPATIGANDLLLALMAEGKTMVHTWPAGWTELADQSGFSVGYRFADGTEDGTTIDVTTGSAARAGAYIVQCFTGGSFLAPQSANASFSNTDAADPPNLAPTWPQADMTVCAVAMCNNSSGDCGGVFPTNYSDNQLTYANSGGGLAGVINFATREINAASEDPGAYPILGAGGRAFTIALAFSTPSLILNPYRNRHILVR